MTQLLTSESAEFIGEIERHPRYSQFVSLHDSIEQLDDEKFDLDRRWVKCQRLIRTLENVAYAANLPIIADQATHLRFNELLAAEAGVFGPAASEAPVAEQVN